MLWLAVVVLLKRLGAGAVVLAGWDVEAPKRPPPADEVVVGCAGAALEVNAEVVAGWLEVLGFEKRDGVAALV